VTHCPGCSGHLGTSEIGFGHILGCGWRGTLSHHEDPRHDKKPTKHSTEDKGQGGWWDRKQQLNILSVALTPVLGRAPTDAEVVKLAEGLSSAINKNPYWIP